jgi:hypothetical protein
VCWAVGAYGVGSTLETLRTRTSIVHWNGKTWSLVTSPNQTGSTGVLTGSHLDGVSCLSTTTCFAVGSSSTTDTRATRPFAVRYSNGHWSIVASSDPAAGFASTLAGVSCVTATGSCFGVGDYFAPAGDYTLVERYDHTLAQEYDPIKSHETFNCHIRSNANHRYVTVQVGGKAALKGRLRAQAPKLGSSREKFQCISIGSNQWAIRSRTNHKYVTADLKAKDAPKGALWAKAGRVGAPEKFAFRAVASCSCFAIKAANSRFVTADPSKSNSTRGLLRAHGASIGPRQRFAITPG